MGQPQGTNGLITSPSKIKGSPCQQDHDSQGAEIEIYSGPSLPEDIWCHIHSFLPMRDAARAACVSRAFLHSWKCHPNLTFDDKIFGLNNNACGNDGTARDFSSKIDQILKKHTGIGVKTLKIHIPKYYNAENTCYLNDWLQIVVTPKIEEFTLTLPMTAKNNFPYSLLSNGSGYSIRHLHLTSCSFHSTTELGWLRSLTRLCLHDVCIKGGELGCLLSHYFALEQLRLVHCDRIVYLNVPCTLQRLSNLEVFCCDRLKVMDSKAPNLSSFSIVGDKRVQLSLGETLQMKNLYLYFSGAVHYARVELPSSMPNLETATIYSSSEVSQRRMEHVSIFTDLSDLRWMPEQHHHKLKSVKILGFTSAKSLVELTCHVVESTTSLECLTLEAHQSSFRCFVPDDNCSRCSSLPIDVLMEAQRALFAISAYIEPKVPSTVKLDVVEPCRRCHAAEL